MNLTTNSTATTTTQEPEVRIDYDHDDFVTQRYVIIVNGKEFMRFNTYAKAEGAIAWHTKNNSLPTWEKESDNPVLETASIEFSHSINDVDSDINEVSKEVFIYRVNGLMIGFLQVDMSHGYWINGDGHRYDEWRDAGVALLTAINKDLIHSFIN